MKKFPPYIYDELLDLAKENDAYRPIYIDDYLSAYPEEVRTEAWEKPEWQQKLDEYGFDQETQDNAERSYIKKLLNEGVRLADLKDLTKYLVYTWNFSILYRHFILGQMPHWDRDGFERFPGFNDQVFIPDEEMGVLDWNEMSEEQKRTWRKATLEELIRDMKDWSTL